MEGCRRVARVPNRAPARRWPPDPALGARAVPERKGRDDPSPRQRRPEASGFQLIHEGVHLRAVFAGAPCLRPDPERLHELGHPRGIEIRELLRFVREQLDGPGGVVVIRQQQRDGVELGARAVLRHAGRNRHHRQRIRLRGGEQVDPHPASERLLKRRFQHAIAGGIVEGEDDVDARQMLEAHLRLLRSRDVRHAQDEAAQEKEP